MLQTARSFSVTVRIVSCTHAQSIVYESLVGSQSGRYATHID